jgi:hypothetical protein
LNGSGTAVDGVNNQINSNQCGNTGGFWVDGTVTDARFAHGSLILSGTTDGENRTSASYGLGPDPGLLALKEAGKRASRDLRTLAIGEGIFLGSLAGVYGGPSTLASLAVVGGEIGAIGPGVALLKLAQKYGLNANSPKSRQVLENLDMRVEDFVGKYRLGSIKNAEGWRFNGMTVREALEAGARKLLTDKRFDK